MNAAVSSTAMARQRKQKPASYTSIKIPTESHERLKAHGAAHGVTLIDVVDAMELVFEQQNDRLQLQALRDVRNRDLQPQAAATA